MHSLKTHPSSTKHENIPERNLWETGIRLHERTSLRFRELSVDVDLNEVCRAGTCTQIQQHRSKSELSMRWLNAGDSGDAAIKASRILTQPSRTGLTLETSPPKP